MKRKIFNILAFSTILSASLAISSTAMGADLSYGDVDGDGAITETDASLVLEKALNPETTLAIESIYPNDYDKFIDVDRDGEITATDAAYILRKANDSSYTLPVDEIIESDIVLSDNSITVNGLSENNGGVEIYNTDNYIIINRGGTYNISGTLTNGQIIVNSTDDVEINLQNVSITNNSGPAIYGLNGDIDISAKKGTTNTLSDGTPTTLDEDGEPDACIYSSDGLKLKGTGSLTINGNYANGISGKDEVIIQKLNLTINSVDNAIKAKDSLTVNSGTITATSSQGDGIRCTKGDIIISDGTVNVTTNNNGIYAKKGNVTVNGGDITVNAVSDNPDTETFNYDGIKATSNVYVNGGTINVTALGEGIQTDLNTEITGGTVTIDAGDTGINADADINISGGVVDVTAVDKGINSTAGNITISDNADVTVNVLATSANADTDTYNYDGIHTKVGTIAITGGTVTVNSYCDGIQSAGDLTISNSPTINVTTTGVISSTSSGNGFGGWTNNQTADISAKGIKSDTSITIEGGTITVNSTDDSVHSNTAITVNGGELSLSTGDDGIHADELLTINGGSIDVLESYEGIEAESIYINDGEIHINADDDSINGAGGNDSSSSGGFNANADGYIEINGGYIYCVNTKDGDGIDSNGKIVMNNGTLIINGPTENDNGAIDYGDKSSDYMAYNGGTIIAVGSSGMAAYPTSSYSSGNTILYGISSSGMGGGQNKPGGFGGGMGGSSSSSSSTISADTLITIADSDGNVIAAFKPKNNVQSIVFSSEDIKTGTTYTIYKNGTYSGTLSSDNYGTGGTISGGTKVASGTVTSNLTTLS